VAVYDRLGVRQKSELHLRAARRAFQIRLTRPCAPLRVPDRLARVVLDDKTVMQIHMRYAPCALIFT
jgi:hypothetical protein